MTKKVRFENKFLSFQQFITEKTISHFELLKNTYIYGYYALGKMSSGEIIKRIVFGKGFYNSFCLALRR